MLPETKLDKIKALLDSLSESDFSEILTNEISAVDKLGNFNIDLFSRVIGAEKLATVASLTAKHIQEHFLGGKPKLKAKIEHLLNTRTESSLIEIYRSTFLPLLNNIFSAEDHSFDRNLINTNYRLILLDLLACEDAKDDLEIIAREIVQELNKMKQTTDFEYFDILIDTLKKKKKAGDNQAALIFSELDKEITLIIENAFWLDTLPENFRHFLDYPESSALGIQFYLSKIFDEEKISAAVLKLFLRFFPENLNFFYDCLSKRRSDIGFIEKIISIVKTLDSDQSLDILEGIYSSSNNYTKIYILITMRELGRYRKEFLMDIISQEDISLRKEALLILIQDTQAKQMILRKFFDFEDPWKIDSNVLLSNIKLIEELEIKEAKDYLTALYKKLFFWNWNIKRKIRGIMDKWK